MTISVFKRITAVICLTVACALCWSAVASAGVSRSLVGSFGPDGLGSGTFLDVQGVAVDSSADVYVYDTEAERGSIYKFDSSGKPVNFSGLAGNVITGVGGGANAENEIAVSSAGPTSGDIYIVHYGRVEIYAPSGTPLGTLESGGPGWGQSCGVATDPAGDLYVSLIAGYVNRYVPVANPVASTDYTSSLYGLTTEPCNIAVDSNGDVDEVLWESGPVTSYPSSQFNTSGTVARGTVLDAAGSTLAIDQSTDEAFVDEQNAVAQYDSSLNRIGAFGAGLIGKSFGIAVTGPFEEENVYVADGARIDIFGPAIVVYEPSVNDQAPFAANVKRTSVTLSATINPGGADTTYHFAFGTTEAYGAVTQPLDAGSGKVDIAAGPVGVGSLQPETTYHYTLVATNALGTVTGPDYTFTTAARKLPLVSTGVPMGVSTTAATLAGAVNPDGVRTSYEFQLGTTTDYDGAEIFGNAGEGEVAEGVSTTVQYLTPGTTYHYRMLATNTDGTSYGADQTFTTPAVSSPIVQTSSAPLIAFTPIAFPAEKASKTVGKKIKRKPGKKRKKHGKHGAAPKKKK